MNVLPVGAVQTRTDSTFFAVLAVIAVVLGIGYVLGGLLTSTPWTQRFRATARPLAAAIATTAMLGSLYFSEVRELEPCRWCWYQRIAWYPLALILVVSVVRRDRNAHWYAWPLVVVGGVIASYHHLIERYPDLADESSCSLTVPCTAPYFRVWGQITIAAMSVMGFVSVALLLLVDRKYDRSYPTSKESQ